MRCLIDADLPQSLVDVLETRGHDAVHVRSIGLVAAADPEIAARAIAERRCILTADHDFRMTKAAASRRSPKFDIDPFRPR